LLMICFESRWPQHASNVTNCRGLVISSRPPNGAGTLSHSPRKKREAGIRHAMPDTLHVLAAFAVSLVIQGFAGSSVYKRRDRIAVMSHFPFFTFSANLRSRPNSQRCPTQSWGGWPMSNKLICP
jgi:hypothetical protein